MAHKLTELQERLSEIYGTNGRLKKSRRKDVYTNTSVMLTEEEKNSLEKPSRFGIYQVPESVTIPDTYGLAKRHHTHGRLPSQFESRRPYQKWEMARVLFKSK